MRVFGLGRQPDPAPEMAPEQQPPQPVNAMTYLCRPCGPAYARGCGGRRTPLGAVPRLAGAILRSEASSTLPGSDDIRAALFQEQHRSHGLEMHVGSNRFPQVQPEQAGGFYVAFFDGREVEVLPGSPLGGAVDAPGHGNGATAADRADDDSGGLFPLRAVSNRQCQAAGAPPGQDPPEQRREAETHLQLGPAGTSPVAAGDIGAGCSACAWGRGPRRSGRRCRQEWRAHPRGQAGLPWPGRAW